MTSAAFSGVSHWKTSSSSPISIAFDSARSELRHERTSLSGGFQSPGEDRRVRAPAPRGPSRPCGGATRRGAVP